MADIERKKAAARGEKLVRYRNPDGTYYAAPPKNPLTPEEKKAARDFYGQNRGDVATPVGVATPATKTYTLADAQRKAMGSKTMGTATAEARLDTAAAEARERFTGPVLQSDGNMRGAKSLLYNKGTLGEDNDLMQNFGKGTPAVLHGNEAVLNEEQLANLARGIPLAAETLLKKVRSPSAEGVKANEAVSQFMKTGAGDMNKDIMKRIDAEGQFKSDSGENYRKDSKGNYVFGGSEGVYVYSPQGKLLSYSTPTIGGIKFKKDLKTGNVTQSMRYTNEEGMKIRRSKTFDESGVGLSGSFQSTMGDVTVGGDTSGRMFSRIAGIEKKTQLTGAALEEAQKEMMTPMTPTNVVAPTDNSTVNNVVNNTQTSEQKPQARNNDGSSRRYGGSVSFGM